MENSSQTDLTNNSGVPPKKMRFDQGGGDDFPNSDDFRGVGQRNRKRSRGGRQIRNNSGNFNHLNNDGGNFGRENVNPPSDSGSRGNNEWQQRTNVVQRLRQLSENPLELGPIEMKQIKFSGRSRLYVGNLISKTTEADLREMFKPYGEIDDIFCNLDKNFTFLRVDYYDNAVKAKRALDGSMLNGRTVRVSFAPTATMVSVYNLNAFVSNELLYKSFEVFGPIERASIKVNDRGKHLGEGVVEFAMKSSAKLCVRMCKEKCFFLTASLRPCVVEPMEMADNTEGLSEISLNKKLPDYIAERSVGPRFADVDSFEHEYGSKWKVLRNNFKMREEELKRELRKEEKKLDAQMEFIRHEREVARLREELRQRELMQERRRQYWEFHEKLDDKDPSNHDRRPEMQMRMGRQDSGLESFYPNEMDYGYQRGGGGGVGGSSQESFRRDMNNGPINRQDNAYYRKEMQERMIHQGDAMQRFQQINANGYKVLHSTPFEVFQNSSSEELDASKINELNETDNTAPPNNGGRRQC